MKQYRFLIGLGLLLAVTLAGCAQGQPAPETVPSTQSVAPTESAVKAENETQRECDWILCTSSEERQSFSSEDLGGNFDGSLYLNRLEVSVVVDGTKMSLEDAVREEKFTIEQLIANVQTDARKGVCTEETRTINGLTEFHYTYKDVFVLDVINDVYQTPDGQEYLYRKVTISKNGPNMTRTTILPM